MKKSDKTKESEDGRIDWFLNLPTIPDDSFEEQDRFEHEKERMSKLSFDEMLDELINLRTHVGVL